MVMINVQLPESMRRSMRQQEKLVADKVLRDSPEGKVVRQEGGITITDFDPDRAPPAPKGYT
jgi:hypothetical protein